MKEDKIFKMLDYASGSFHAFYQMTDDKGKSTDISYGINKLRNLGLMIKRYGLEEFLKDISSPDIRATLMEVEKSTDWTA